VHTPEPDVVVAVAGAIEQGRLVAVGDPSIVMNSMLAYGDNEAFARGVLRYMGEREDKTPFGSLYILSGRFTTRGYFAGHGSDAASQLLQWMDRIREEGFSSDMAYLLAIATSSLLLRWALRQTRKHEAFVRPKYVAGTNAPRVDL